MQADAQLEQTKNQLKTQYLQAEVEAKKQLMAYEFELNSKLEMMKQQTTVNIEDKREDRRDQRVNMQALHQKEMINKRSGGDSTENFESSGNDIITGNAGLET